MEIFKLHLEINQRLQEVASFKRNKYFPEEIDLALNKAMFRILEKGVEVKFQSDQINLATVSALIQKNRPLDVLIPQTTDPLYEENILTGYSLVPTDLYWTLGTRAEIVTDPLNCDTAPTLATSSINEYMATITYPTPGSSAPFYQNLAISSSAQGTLYSSPIELASGVADEQGKYILTRNIVEKFYRTESIGIFWERYRDVYYRNQFIVVSSNPLGTVAISCTGRPSITSIATQSSYIVYNRGLIPSLISKKVSIAAPRIDKQDALYQALYQNTYYTPKPTEPLINQTSDYLILYRDKSFLITRLYADYIRKPRTISLSLSQTCELDESMHPKLIDMAVEILRLDTKDPAYVATVQDTQLRS